MMDQDRNLGVTEARFGLTLLICFLVAVGYVVLLRLGGASESIIEVRPEGVLQDNVAHEATVPDKDNGPLVLKTELPKASEERMSKRPARPESTHSEDKSAPPADPVIPTGSIDLQRR